LLFRPEAIIEPLTAVKANPMFLRVKRFFISYYLKCSINTVIYNKVTLIYGKKG
jgi:hypothetical protein